MGMRKDLFENYKQCGHAPSNLFASPPLCGQHYPGPLICFSTISTKTLKTYCTSPLHFEVLFFLNLNFSERLNGRWGPFKRCRSFTRPNIFGLLSVGFSDLVDRNVWRTTRRTEERLFNAVVDIEQRFPTFWRDNVLYFVVMGGPTHRNVTSQQDRRKEKKWRHRRTR